MLFWEQVNRMTSTATLRLQLCRPVLLLLLASIGLAACDQNPTSNETSAPANVIAKVNDEVITQEDVDFSLERMFSQANTMTVNTDVRQKVVDSLISSSAMKQLIVNEMTDTEIKQIAARVKAYEEELFVKEYLQRYVEPEPVTTAMVQQYYEEHPEEFGAEVLRDFELLKAPANIDDEQRQQLLTQIDSIRAAPDWQAAVKAWQQDFGLQYRQGRNGEGLLNRTLEKTINSLGEGETSDVVTIDNEIHLVRITNITQTPPKALAEVSGDIRKRLAPLLLREAVRKASEDARSKVEIVVTDSDK